MRGQVFHTILVPDWPGLAWVATYDLGSGAVIALHGAKVEVGSEGLVEGVWDSNFEQFAFDQTDLMFGSGIRLRDGEIRFVSSGSTTDRLWWWRKGLRGGVANTLPGLLSQVGVELTWDYPRYRQDIESVIAGLDRYVRDFPVSEGNLEVVYWEDLVLGAGRIRREPKPSVNRAWTDFHALLEFYEGTAIALGRNSSSSARAQPITPVATISSGYDSTAASVIARNAGATKAFTISSARALLPRSDSGQSIAQALGLACRVVEPRRSRYSHEQDFLAALGWSMDMNVSLFEFEDPLTLLFTGFHGDKVWDRTHGIMNSQIVRGDPSGLGMAEYRLRRGVINCPVPFWGVKEAQRIRAITTSAEMLPWTLGGDYDRPVPRRIAESAGVPRKWFGVRKSATTLDMEVIWPRTQECEAAFVDSLHERGLTVPSVRMRAILNQCDMSLLKLVRDRVGWFQLTLWKDLQASAFLFPWAVQQLSANTYGASSPTRETAE